MSYLKIFAIGLFAFTLAACSSPTLPDPDPQESTMDDQAGTDTDGYGEDGMGGGEEIDYASEGPAMIIYFDFDSSEVRPEDADTVTRHALQLANNGSARIRLEGHADERGSREYNIGLGERRAQSVRRMLLIQGASSGQIQTVSFGEERPAAMGSGESAWAQNRRVEIRYIN